MNKSTMMNGVMAINEGKTMMFVGNDNVIFGGEIVMVLGDGHCMLPIPRM
jgi:hypothetical protein